MRKIFFNTILCLLLLNLLNSCSNIVENIAGKDFSFSLGEETASQIVRTVSSASNITNNTNLKVVCDLNGTCSRNQTEIITLGELKNLKLNFNNLPFGTDYYFDIKIYFNDVLIYSGISEKFNLTKEERNLKINVRLGKKSSKIEYTLNGGTFSQEQENLKLNEYYIDSEYVIPEPDKLKNKFNGWYLNSECTGEPVKELGKNNFIGNVKLYAKWSESYNISEVTEVKSTIGNGQITLTWKNPPEAELQKIEIKCIEDNGKSKNITNKGQSVDITGLTNGQKYTFDITAISISNDRSKTVKKETFALDTTSIKLTESVKTLDPGTDGTAGTSGTYVEFGDYPQSLKAADVLVSENTVKVNGFDCYYGIDGSYYVKAKANMFKYKDTHNDSTKPESLYRFDNEDLIKEGGEYYFKVEPIKWRVVDTAYSDVGPLVGKQQVTGKLLLAESVLNGTQFYKNNYGTRSIGGKSIESNNYEYSSIRAYLNGYDGSSWGDSSNNAGDFTGKGFINQAFTSAAQGYINEVTVDNGIETTKNSPESSVTTEDYAVWKEHSYSCEPTTDKVFLLSQREATTKKYFPEDWLAFDSFSRYRKTTEYARTVGASSNMDRTSQSGKTYKNGDWWLRSPHWAQFGNNKCYRRSRYIGCNGRGNRGNDCHAAYGGVVPAIVIEGTSTKDTTAPGTVTDLTYKTGNGKVIFSWTPPTDRDFAKVEIVCKEDTGKKVIVKKGTNTCTISGLANGKKYIFEAKAYDASDNYSSAVPIEASLYVLTENVKTLNGADGSAGTSGTYVEFGDYPQTYVKDAPVTAESVTVGDLTYYYGTDGYYYVKAKASLYNSVNSGKTFGDNTPIANGSEYCFRVEPVKWRVLDNAYGVGTDKLLLCENVLVNSKFKSTTGAGANDYKNSDIKNFLKNSLLPVMFTSGAQGNIKPFTGDGLNDSLFLLSRDDVKNAAYGFPANDSESALRGRKTTDYARALGAYSDDKPDTTAEMKANGSWWLRTAAPASPPTVNDTDFVFIAGSKGGAGSAVEVNNNSGGVVPAVVVK